jgi:tetratricopeptide (TPR) repeat protein
MKNIFAALLPIFSLLMFCTNAFAQDETLQELNYNSVRLFEQGKYNEAAELADRALKSAENKYGPESTQITPFLNNLAVIYYAQGRYSEAEALYERALGIAEPVFSLDHPRIKSLIEGLQKCRQKLPETEIPEESDESDETDEPIGLTIPEGTNEGKIQKDFRKPVEESTPGTGETSGKLYTVQVGAFKNLMNAKRLQERLDKNGYNATLTTVTDHTGGTLHKVQIGEFDHRKRAKGLAQELITLMRLDIYITTK